MTIAFIPRRYKTHPQMRDFMAVQGFEINGIQVDPPKLGGQLFRLTGDEDSSVRIYF